MAEGFCERVGEVKWLWQKDALEKYLQQQDLASGWGWLWQEDLASGWGRWL
ncbi:hypothetical protein T484DRAFT_1823835 [Baffinella frigidus]|nr:hypothetical protein T484DRAFT_1823835 [Cryptophyta sp. CCMP2293]